MNAMEKEEAGADRRHELLQEASAGWSEMKTPAFPLRVLLFTAAGLIALGARMKLWYRSAPSQGNLPNLHID